jgi:hypothetical protein
MENEDEKRKLLGQLEKALEWYRKNEDSSRMEIMVDKDVYDKAEAMAKALNTDVEGIFALTSYRLIREEDLPSRAQVGGKRARQLLYVLH